MRWTTLQTPLMVAGISCKCSKGKRLDPNSIIISERGPWVFFFLHLTFTLQIILIKLIRGVKDTFRLMQRSPYHRGAVPKADLAAAVHASWKAAVYLYVTEVCEMRLCTLNDKRCGIRPSLPQTHTHTHTYMHTHCELEYSGAWFKVDLRKGEVRGVYNSDCHAHHS